MIGAPRRWVCQRSNLLCQHPHSQLGLSHALHQQFLVWAVPTARPGWRLKTDGLRVAGVPDFLYRMPGPDIRIPHPVSLPDVASLDPHDASSSSASARPAIPRIAMRQPSPPGVCYYPPDIAGGGSRHGRYLLIGRCRVQQQSVAYLCTLRALPASSLGQSISVRHSTKRTTNRQDCQPDSSSCQASSSSARARLDSRSPRRPW